MDRDSVVEESDGNETLNWSDELEVLDEYVKNRQKLVKMVSQSENMWDVHLGSVMAMKQQTELDKWKDHHIHSGPYQVGSKAKEFGKQEIENMLSSAIIDLA